MTIRIEHVSQVWPGGVAALENIELEIQRGEFMCLLGPSGCGKSTLLNAIAGFVAPSQGRVLIDDRPVTRPGPDRGMVFQEYALFPWLTVAQNIGFGLEIKSMARAAIDERVERLLQLLHLHEFRDRFPKDLSGGMCQRVAIARVLAIEAPIMLMDEPFAALDALTRRSLQDELLKIWAQFGCTIVFVTHSIDEALYLADRIAVMTYRPGTLKRQLSIELERPRDPSAPEFNALKRNLTEMVMQEQVRFEAGAQRGLE